MGVVYPGYRSTPTTGNITIGGASASSPNYASASSIVGGAGSGYTWANPNSKSNGTIKLEGSDADIFVQGKSMKAWMDAVEKRLFILEPKPELLTKYKALEQAYEHYKTLEAILYEQE